jgi:hypothetical protein
MTAVFLHCHNGLKIKKMKQILFILLFVCGTFIANATNDDEKVNNSDNTATLVLTGSVADEISGETLVGVEVKIEGTDQKTYTDFDGNFVFRNVKPGEYNIVANDISYQKCVETMNVSSNEKEVKIKLQTSN